MKKADIIRKSRDWVERFVIGLHLCPFAKRPYDKNQVRFEVCLASEAEQQLTDLWKEIELLAKAPKEKISNAILIFPNGLNDFGEYLDFYFLAEKLLQEQNKDDQFQLASFHPDYQFENTEKNDVTNYTNRSPFPFIHILRIEEVAEAIDNYPEVDKVPGRNKKRLTEMGVDKIKQLGS
ncbi:MAG: DUF1415 domain-containing protein [Bacteroidota bacterium]